MLVDKYNDKSITKPEQIAKFLQEILLSENEVDQDKEHFWSIGLNNSNVIQYVELVSLGTLNSSLVSPRETFRFAIMKGVAAIIVAHNHPSGSLHASMNDIDITDRLHKSGEIIDIKLLDHIIISKTGFISFRNDNIFQF